MGGGYAVKKFLMPIIIVVAYAAFFSVVSADNGYSLTYTLNSQVADRPVVEIAVQGAPENVTLMEFYNINCLGRFEGNLDKIFVDIKAVDMAGHSLPVSWKDKWQLKVSNGSARNFKITYAVDAKKLSSVPDTGEISKTFAGEMYAVFNNKVIYFIVGDIFMLPKTEPSAINVKCVIPKGLQIFSTLTEENGSFRAGKDLWGSLTMDFSKSFFTGGKPAFVQEHRTKRGDNYKFIFFDWDTGIDRWFPSYKGNNAEIAKRYMETLELYEDYYRKNIGELPVRNVLITNAIPHHIEGIPMVMGRTNWLHYMQIWPETTVYLQVGHHVFHQYAFRGIYAKLTYEKGDGILGEGIPTFFEHTVNARLFGHDYYTGRMMNILAMEERGKRIGIKDNQYHKQYNDSTLKVYLLDKYIKEKTVGMKSIMDFVRELWALAKDDKEPENLSEDEIAAAFEKTAGTGARQKYIEIRDLKQFNRADFKTGLMSYPFYAEKTAKAFFWSSKLLFCAYMDVAAMKGEHWPHFAVYEHNIPMMKAEALGPFKNYLAGLKKTTFTKTDIENALKAVTGKDHSGFFEFWETYGVKLDPSKLPPLKNWDLGNEDWYTPGYIPSMKPTAN